MVLMVFDIWYTFSMPVLNQNLPSGDTWPPPPAVVSPVIQSQTSPRWFRPALWLGIGFNVLFCLPSLLLLNFPNGSELLDNTLFLFPHLVWVVTALLAFFSGALFAAGQIRKRQKQQHSFWWEAVGLMLCSTPFFAGMSAVDTVVKLKAFSPPP